MKYQGSFNALNTNIAILIIIAPIIGCINKNKTPNQNKKNEIINNIKSSINYLFNLIISQKGKIG